MLRMARAFFERRGVLEVETPILSAAAVSDPQIESLTTQIAGIPERSYLCPSPEYAMKRLLAAGSGDIYQICKVFRDAERGRWHNPEFTMIEWYRLGFDDSALMDEVEMLVGQLLAPARTLARAERLSYSAALQRHAGVDAFSSTDDELLDAAQAPRNQLRCRTRPRWQARSFDGVDRRAAAGTRETLLRLRLSGLAGRAARLKPGVAARGGAF